MSVARDLPAPLADDVPALLAGAAGAGQPLLTYYDDATGERTELSAAALTEWTARTTALLRDGCGLQVGTRAAVLLPPHWQTAAVLFGAWSAGIAVSFRLAATAGLPALGEGQHEPLDVSFVAHNRLDNWLDNVPDAYHRFVLGLAPDAGRMRDVPYGYLDFIAEVQKYGDAVPTVAPTVAPVRRTDAASVDGTSYREWGSLAEGMAEVLGLNAGDRLLVDATEHEHPVKWLLAPLAAGASVVLCANLDRAKLEARVATEGVTRIL